MYQCWFKRSVSASSVLLVLITMMPRTERSAFAEDPPVETAYKYLQEGGKLNADQLPDLENKLEANAKNLPDRLRLIGYYQKKVGFGGMISDGPGVKALVGLVEHHPTFALAVNLTSPVLPPAFHEVARQWKAVAAANPQDALITGNAGTFLTSVTSHYQTKHVGEGKELLLKAHQLEPQNPRWPRQLGRAHAPLLDIKTPGTVEIATRDACRTGLNYLEVAYKLTDEKARVSAGEKGELFLLEMATMALAADESTRAKDYASELLQSLDDTTAKTNWNYGNAVYNGNVILGHIALAEGNIPEAKKFLLAAARTPGSPQLGSFGPNMSLAEQLLMKGEKQVVLEYIELCGKFWKRGGARLDELKKAVEEGSKPKFSKY